MDRMPDLPGGFPAPLPKSASARERARVVQLIDAVGWMAVFEHADGEARLPVAAWALLEYSDDRSGEERFTVGLLGGAQPRLVRADQVQGLLRYEKAG